MTIVGPPAGASGAGEGEASLVERVFRGADSLYVVLDAARDPAVYPAIRASGRPFQSLYDGKLAPEIQAVAPYLVDLRVDDPFTARLLAEGWGQSWGVFLAASGGLVEVRRHLRRFLRVHTEDGKALLFRFYDPRVLRVYLPTCTPAELATFFGPIERFVVEDEAGRAPLTFDRPSLFASLGTPAAPAH